MRIFKQKHDLYVRLRQGREANREKKGKVERVEERMQMMQKKSVFANLRVKGEVDKKTGLLVNVRLHRHLLKFMGEMEAIVEDNRLMKEMA